CKPGLPLRVRHGTYRSERENFQPSLCHRFGRDRRRFLVYQSLAERFCSSCRNRLGSFLDLPNVSPGRIRHLLLRDSSQVLRFLRQHESAFHATHVGRGPFVSKPFGGLRPKPRLVSVANTQLPIAESLCSPVQCEYSAIVGRWVGGERRLRRRARNPPVPRRG